MGYLRIILLTSAKILWKQYQKFVWSSPTWGTWSTDGKTASFPFSFVFPFHTPHCRSLALIVILVLPTTKSVQWAAISIAVVQEIPRQ